MNSTNKTIALPQLWSKVCSRRASDVLRDVGFGLAQAWTQLWSAKSGATPRIRLGIVGCGVMGARHARIFRNMAGCALVAVADIAPKKANSISARYGIPQTFSSMEEMIGGVELDAVSIVTSDSSHVPLALEAIRRGKHVFCEKPLATNGADASHLATVAAEAGVVNMINLSYRNAPAIHTARALIESGVIGRIVHVEGSYLQDWLGSSPWRSDESSFWRLSSQYGNKGVLSDLGIHVLDFASYPVGNIAAVNCRLRSFDSLKENAGQLPLDASDSAVLHLEFGNGAIGVIHTTRWGIGHKNSLRLRIFGELGALLIDLDVAQRHLWICNGPRLKSARWQRVRCPDTPSNYQSFISSIQSGFKAEPDFKRGAYIQQVLDCCELSSQSGATVKIHS